MRNILEPQIVIDLTTNYRPINLLSTILVCAKVLTNIGKCGLGIDLKATSHSETLESNFLPTGPAKASGVFILPPNATKTWHRGSSSVCQRQTTHCSGLWRASSNFLIQPLLLPVILAAPSVRNNLQLPRFPLSRYPWLHCRCHQ